MIAPANTFIASVLPVLKLGAEVVLVDCDEATGLIDVDAAAAAVTRADARADRRAPLRAARRPRPLVELCDARGIALVEDACQAHGARYKGRRVGSFGRFAAFSFYPSKNLGALGDAGAVTTDDDELARADPPARHGSASSRRACTSSTGWNERLDTLQAAALRVKLRHLDALERRAAPASRAGTSERSRRRAAGRRRRGPSRSGTSTSSAHRAATSCATALAERGIGTGHPLSDAAAPPAGAPRPARLRARARFPTAEAPRRASSSRCRCTPELERPGRGGRRRRRLAELGERVAA